MDRGQRLQRAESNLRPARGDLLPGLFGLLLVIRQAQQDGTWWRLKVCGNPDCEWAFYDRSRNQQGNWCDMAVCGNRIKNRQLRARLSIPVYLKWRGIDPVAGDRYLCPIHRDTGNPGFVVFRDSGRAYCHACGAKSHSQSRGSAQQG